MSDWAAKVLEGGERCYVEYDGDMIPSPTGSWICYHEALAAIARMGAGDGLVERLNRADEYEPLGHDGWEAAAHIAALTAENREMALDVLASSGQAADAYAAQIAAEAEAAALRAKVARLEDKIKDWEARIDDCEWSTNSSLTEGIRAEMRAAITDGGKDG